MRNLLRLSIFLCVLAFAACVVWANEPIQEPKTPVLNEITQTAVQSGVLTCSSRINQVSSFLTGSINSGALVFKQAGEADKEMFSASIEIVPSKGGSVYATASFAPNARGGCTGVYDTVEYLNASCAEVETTVLKETSRVGVLNKDITARASGTIRFFLMPAGQGCLIIKKEIVG